MSCPTDEQLRAHVDVADERTTTHLHGCATCADRLATVADDARVAAAALADLDPDVPAVDDVDTASAWVAMDATSGRSARSRVPAGIAAAVTALAIVAALVVTPTGRATASAFLASFRSERLEAVAFDPQEPTAGFEALADVLDVDHSAADDAGPVTVDTLAQAADISGFAPAEATTLPAGATLDAIEASAPRTGHLTLHADRAPDLPPTLEGAQLVVSVPGAVVTTYVVDDRVLVIGESGQLAVEAVGADLAEIRDYLLGRPEVPDDVARQLLAIDDWTTTLPVPVPVDRMVWQDTTVGGAPGLMLTDAVGSGLLWQRDGRIHAVGAEGLDIDVVRAVADGLD